MVSLYIWLNSNENKERANGITHFNNGGPMDTGYPALIADPPKQNDTKSPTVPGAADSEAPQATPTNPDPTGSPPTIKQTSWGISPSCFKDKVYFLSLGDKALSPSNKRSQTRRGVFVSPSEVFSGASVGGIQGGRVWNFSWQHLSPSGPEVLHLELEPKAKSP